MSTQAQLLVRRAWRILVVAVLYYALARLGLSFAALPGKVSPVWLPTGLALAAVFVYGWDMAIGVFIGAFFVNLGGLPVAAAVTLGVGNTLEACIGAAILKRYGVKAALSRPRDVAVLMLVATGATFVSASIGVLTLHQAGIIPIHSLLGSLRVWWVGDALGALVVAPPLLMWASNDGHERPNGSRPELYGLIGAFVVASLVGFTGARPAAFLVFPITAWAAIRYGGRGATTATSIAAAIAVHRTLAGYGVFATGHAVSDLWQLDAFLVVLSLQALLLAAVVSERDRSQRETLSANALLEARVRERTAALRTDRQSLEQAQRIAHIGSWELDIATNQITWSDELQRLFGYEVGTAPRDFDLALNRVHPEDRPSIDAFVSDAIEYGEAFNTVIRLALPDNQLRWLRARGQADVIAGRVVQLNGICQDITESKLTEDRLRATEERTTRIVDAASEAFVTMDLDERITDWNRQAELTFGWQRSEVLGRSMVDVIIPKSEREGHRKGVSRFLKTGETKALNTRREVRALHRDGHEFPIEMAVWLTEGIDSELTFHAFMHDISDREAEKAALDSALDEAREASRLKSAFLANMSHEIRTPMNGVMGMIGLLLDTKLTATQRDYIQTMTGSAAALGFIIDDILDVSKIEAGKLEIDTADYALRDLVQSTVAPFLPAATGKSISLFVTIATSAPDFVHGDGRRVRQVIGNLLANAVKFTAAGEVTLTVSKRANALRFEVRDSGIGVSTDACKRLFEPFVQADASTTRRYGGTGLGLAISRDLVRLMGGEIGVESTPNVGSLFWFSLPFVPAAAALVVTPVATTDLSASAGARVLVVEDNPVNRKVAVGILTQLGYRTDIAVDGVAAVEAFGRATYDAILMDCQMPRMDGYDATRAIRALETATHTPIVAVTASAMAADRDRCLAAGMDEFLTKPVERDKLAGTLRRCLDGTICAAVVTPARAKRSRTGFDVAAVEALRAIDNDGAFLHDLVQTFHDDVATDMVRLRAAMTNRDVAATREIAHRQKGASANLGLRRLSASFLAIERGADSLPAAIETCFGRVEHDLTAARAYLATVLAPIETPSAQTAAQSGARRNHKISR